MSTTPMNAVVVMHRGTPVVFPLDRAECSLNDG